MACRPLKYSLRLLVLPAFSAFLCWQSLAAVAQDGPDIYPLHQSSSVFTGLAEDITCLEDWPDSNLEVVARTAQDQRGQLSVAWLTRQVIYRVKTSDALDVAERIDGLLDDFVDLIVFYHAVDQRIPVDVRRQVDEILKDASPVATKACPIQLAPTGEIPLYSPFYRMVANKPVTVQNATAIVVRSVVLGPRDGAKDEQNLDPLAHEKDEPKTSEPEVIDHNYWYGVRPYAWIDAQDHSIRTAGESVLAVHQLRCEKAGNFVVASIGTTIAPLGGTTVDVKRERMIAANNYVSVNFSADDKENITADVNAQQYWCIPKKEFCHQTISFGDFSVKGQKFDVERFDAREVVSLRHGLVSSLEKFIVDRCLKEVAQ